MDEALLQRRQVAVYAVAVLFAAAVGPNRPAAAPTLERLIARKRYEFDYVPLVANLLELVPVRDEEERQVVLKAVNYYDEGMTPFDALHAATVETRGMGVLSSQNDYDGIEVERVLLEPTDEE
nr:hypothetical protein [Halolamina sediminis]